MKREIIFVWSDKVPRALRDSLRASHVFRPIFFEGPQAALTSLRGAGERPHAIVMPRAVDESLREEFLRELRFFAPALFTLVPVLLVAKEPRRVRAWKAKHELGLPGAEPCAADPVGRHL